MKLGQIKWNNALTAAVFEGGQARPIPDHTLYDLIRRAEIEGATIKELALSMASKHGEPFAPVIPIKPPEVWASGCTYEAGAAFRDGERGEQEGLYAYVYREARPELFLKGTARVCVGPGKPIGIRADSRFTVPEPELAVVLGSKGRVAGYTLVNDVSAWDIERENPLYLPQAKVYAASCAIGPVMVTPDEIRNPYDLHMSCTIRRGEKATFSQSVSTSKLNRKIETLVEYLMRSNPVPCGSVLATGTGIVVTEEAKLEPGDIVTISVSEIGQLSNPVEFV